MNRNTTLALVVVFGLLIVYLLLVQKPKDEAAASATPTAGTTVSQVFTFSSDQVTGFWIVDMGSGKSVAVNKDASGGWRVVSPEVKPGDPAKVTSAISKFSALSVSTSITNPTDLTPFGVLTPTYTLGIDLSDGRHLRAAIGGQTPTNSGYYVLRDGETEVLIINTGSFTSLTGLLTDPPYLLPTPTPTPTVVLTFGDSATPATTPTP